MSQFQREERYIVVKLKRIDSDTQDDLREFLVSYQIPTEQCVVVEHDWPIHEETWENVERLAKGHKSIREERDQLLGLTELLDEHPDGYDGPCLCRSCREYGGAS